MSAKFMGGPTAVRISERTLVDADGCSILKNRNLGRTLVADHPIHGSGYRLAGRVVSAAP